MTINTIRVENVKGIKDRTFSLNIIPNKPSLLVAPNGFGKSSLAAAFAGLNSARLVLPKDKVHLGDEGLNPKLTVSVTKDGVSEVLLADATSNTIFNRYDVHVISSRLVAKSTKRNMGKFTAASASIAIEPFVLVSRIPDKVLFSYAVASMRSIFGRNGKVLKNIKNLLSCPALTEELRRNFSVLDKMFGVRAQRKVAGILENVNRQTGTVEELLQWCGDHIADELEGVESISFVSSVLQRFCLGEQSNIDRLFNAYQICSLYCQGKDVFKDACVYRAYLSDKERFEAIISSFDTTWKNVRPVESKGKLIVEFPSASNISNGQRDSLCFAVWLQVVNSAKSRKDCILVIDEVFDYLDDANLVAVQYYISNIIKERKALGFNIYALILTHLNPMYFKNFTFKDQKIYFLSSSQPSINEHFKRLIVKRTDASISAGVDRYHLHYYPGDINLRAEFSALGLKETWGQSEVFRSHVSTEWQKYASGDDSYDPFAVCCYVRVRIEERVYLRISGQAEKEGFLNANGTTAKMDYAESVGVDVDELFYLLGVIYNEGMHIRENVNNSSPIVSKLENLTLRKMLLEADSV